MRTKICRQLINLGFLETEAKKMSAEFARLLKSLGVTRVKAVASLVKSLAVGILQAWVLALVI